MNTQFRILLLVLAVCFAGCEPNSKSGGPGVTKDTDRGSTVTQADETFSLDVPNLPTALKQGEAQTLEIGIRRGTNFDEDVTLKFDDIPDGVMLDPSSPMIKQGEQNVTITVEASESAALGDFIVKVRGVPTTGAEASNQFSLKINEK
jgi:hypothetical protein